MITMKATNQIKHPETFAELEHLVKYVKAYGITNWTYKFSFAYGYELYCTN